MLNSPVLAEWEMQVRVRNNAVEMERMRLARLAASSQDAPGGRLPASLSLKSLQSFAASGLARSSSLARAAWQRAQPWFSQPPMTEEDCAEA